MSVKYFNMWVDIAGVDVKERELVNEFSNDVEEFVKILLRADKYEGMNFRDFAHDVDVDVEDIAGSYESD